jgi:hypothetical protein
VGELVLVDGDGVEEKNVGRIYNSTLSDAAEGRLKFKTAYLIGKMVEEEYFQQFF